MKDNTKLYDFVQTTPDDISYMRNKETNNLNSIIIGRPGSGKSFLCKREIEYIVKNTEDEVMVLDLYGEYNPFGIKPNAIKNDISLTSNTYINPFDLYLPYSEYLSDSYIIRVTIAEKSQFIISFLSLLLNRALTNQQKSLIDRVIKDLYLDNINAILKERKGGQKICYLPQESPTFDEFYDRIIQTQETCAKDFALQIERFAIGSYDIFTHHTNISIKQYTILNMGNVPYELNEAAYLVGLMASDILIKTRQDCQKKTWFYFPIHSFSAASVLIINRLYLNMYMQNMENTIMTGTIQSLSELEDHNFKQIVSYTGMAILLDEDKNEHIKRVFDVEDRLFHMEKFLGILYNLASPVATPISSK